ncbi:aspartate/glutamate racemase family protein [Kitasatospora sp. NPDC002040]|uniref:glutamate racemase n=1 Tax=Kitasatospora sp. NPDC002040 TaxID=3154661 RepID=UPI0033269868
MKIALVDSGLGLLAAAAALRRSRPDADLVLSSDPDGMPWGPRTSEDIAAHALACALAAAELEPDALVIACNTASVHALDVVRAALEPGLPVIGTVPAIKPASAGGARVAIWATPATTGSPYQHALIREFGGSATITEVACPGLADAVERADPDAIAAAVADAAARTPAGIEEIVLGCTHYELLEEQIRSAVATPGSPPPVCHGSAGAVAAQALRRVGTGRPEGGGTLTVLHSGRVSSLPPAVLHYPEGRLLLGARAAAR